MQATVYLVMRGTVWLLHQRESLRNLDATIKRFAPGVAEIVAGLERWLAPHERASLQADAARLVAQGVPEALADRISHNAAMARWPSCSPGVATCAANVPSASSTSRRRLRI